jgi:hypothetical protein
MRESAVRDLSQKSGPRRVAFGVPGYYSLVPTTSAPTYPGTRLRRYVIVRHNAFRVGLVQHKYQLSPQLGCLDMLRAIIP